jgi:DnaJ-class molecular chaperone
MSPPPLRLPCKTCQGAGTVPRTSGLTADGQPITKDATPVDGFPATCGTCQGSGSVPDPGPAAETAKPAPTDYGCY